MHSVRFLFLPMVLSLLLSGCAQTRETSSTIFAMNTVMELTAYGDSGQQVLDQATERIYQLEHLLSVTDKNSDISAINHGEGAWVPVSQETFQLLSLALSYGRETQGALDITAYSAVHAWGFTTGEYRVPGPEELAELAARIDTPRWSWTRRAAGSRLPQGMQLDLGSIAKGWASDLLAELAGGGARHLQSGRQRADRRGQAGRLSLAHWHPDPGGGELRLPGGSWSSPAARRSSPPAAMSATLRRTARLTGTSWTRRPPLPPGPA